MGNKNRIHKQLSQILIMLLRPFYPVQEKLNTDIIVSELVEFLIRLPNVKNIRRSVLRHFNVRELIVLLHGLTKDDKGDEFYDYNTFETDWHLMWIDVVDALNDFPCVKLVDSYTILSDNSNYPNGLDKNDTLDCYELSIDSLEYDFLLEYLIDSNINKVKFKLIEINTKKFKKISEVLENHCYNLKIQNDNLSVIKDSEKLKEKLSILTLKDYEHYEVVEKLNYKTLNIIGNEIDVFSVSNVIKNNENLETIYFEGRLKDLIPTNINKDITVYYDMIVLDAVDKSQMENLGDINRFNKLYLNLTLESDIRLEWLKQCLNLKSLYLSLAFIPTKSEILTSLSVFPKLTTLTLKHCEVLLENDEDGVYDNGAFLKNIAPSLKSLTLIKCDINSNFLNKINGLDLTDIFLIDCSIQFDTFVKLPKNLRNLTILNEDVEKSKDLIILTYKIRSSFLLKSARSFLLNINESLMNVIIAENHDAFITSLKDPETNLNNKIINVDNLEIPFNSRLNFTVYPNFADIDFSFLKNIFELFDISNINIDIYSFTNVFSAILNIEDIENIQIHKYDVTKLQEHLKKVLAKKELDDQDKKFFSPYPCTREKPLVRVQELIEATRMEVPKEQMITKFIINNQKKKKSIGFAVKIDKLSKDTNNSSTTNSHPPIFVCDVCGKGFARNTALSRHSLTHKNYRPYKCEVCGYCFKRSDHLKVHQRICLDKLNV